MRHWSFGHWRRANTDFAADLWASDEAQFSAALTIVPGTTFALAIATSGHTPYYLNDIDGVRRFELTDDEVAVAAEYIAQQGQDPAYLVSANS